MKSGFEYSINNNRNYTDLIKMQEVWRIIYMRDLGLMSYSHKLTDSQKKRISELTKAGMKKYREENPDYAKKISEGLKKARAEGKMQWDHHVPHPAQSKATKSNYYFCKLEDNTNKKNEAKSKAISSNQPTYKKRSEMLKNNYFFCTEEANSTEKVERKENATAWWKDSEKAKAAVEKARKHSNHHYVIDEIGFDSSWEAAYYLYVTYNDRDEKGVYHGPKIEKDVAFKLEHGTYFVDFKIENDLVEIKSPHFFNDKGELIIPYNNPEKVQDVHSAEKQRFMVENNVKIITDVTEYKSFIEENYGANFIDLFDVNLPFPEPDRDIYKAHRSGMLSPFEAWTVMPLRQKVIFNRLQYGPFGRKEKTNYTDGKFTPKHPMIYPKDLLNGFTIAKVAQKVSEFRPSRTIDLITKYAPDAKTVVDPFAGFGGRAEGCKRLGLSYKGYDINTYKEHEGYNIEHKDILTVQDNNHYDCLLTCCPYDDIEKYGIETVYKSCDDWTDEILKRFPNVDKYIFVVDNKSAKYDKYVVEGITNNSHFTRGKQHKTSSNMEKVIVM